ncbi:hypothetical protein [Halolamina salifodinae]|uniref:DUF7979 domain-containing protein n=1 Tax=Halolamina salifodinae TaxID=1202767 RepID=A0A8T4GVG1_9EURY|nr:hypothetical protein [Halolamina salifodinae]MBP1986102.1 hypothetical protein [Halolamina salifodinae]
MQKSVPTVALAVALLLAGCTGGVGTPETDTSPTVTQTAESTPTEAPTETQTATPTEQSPTTTVEPRSVVDYEELNSQQQDAFRAAIDGEAKFVPNTSYVSDSAGYAFEHAVAFQRHEHVRYDGDLYRISTRAGELYASYQIWASVGSPGENATVVAFDDLPEDIRDEVRTAITEGDYHAPFGKWESLPEPLHEADYVRYDGEAYKMTYAVGDAWATVVTVEQVDRSAQNRDRYRFSKVPSHSGQRSGAAPANSTVRLL